MIAKTSTRMYLPVLALLCAILACETQSPTMPPDTFDPNAINTYIAQTAQSAFTLSAVPIFVPTLTPSYPAPTPTLFSTQTGTPTSAYTFTPSIPIISVSTDTNCRSGPGKGYDYSGALKVGATAEVFGIDPTGKYWYIRNPEDPDHYCWVWDEYASISGSIAFVPIYTPPPTSTPTNTPIPAPDFQITYTGMDTCTGWWLEFKIRNTGVVDLKSVQIELLDKTAGSTVSNLTDGFTNLNGCLSSATRDTLSPGTSTIVSSAAFIFDPTGHDVTAKITACTKIGLSDSCAMQKIRFTP